MENLNISINTGNAAFDDAPASELARILRKLADRLETEGAPPHGEEAFYLHDYNGNRAGVAEIRHGEPREIGLTAGQRTTLHNALSVYEPSHIAHEGAEAERDALLAILFEIRGADTVALLVEG